MFWSMSAWPRDGRAGAGPRRRRRPAARWPPRRHVRGLRLDLGGLGGLGGLPFVAFSISSCSMADSYSSSSSSSASWSAWRFRIDQLDRGVLERGGGQCVEGRVGGRVDEHVDDHGVGLEDDLDVPAGLACRPLRPRPRPVVGALYAHSGCREQLLLGLDVVGQVADGGDHAALGPQHVEVHRHHRLPVTDLVGLGRRLLLPDGPAVTTAVPTRAASMEATAMRWRAIGNAFPRRCGRRLPVAPGDRAVRWTKCNGSRDVCHTREERVSPGTARGPPQQAATVATGPRLLGQGRAPTERADHRRSGAAGSTSSRLTSSAGTTGSSISVTAAGSRASTDRARSTSSPAPRPSSSVR